METTAATEHEDESFAKLKKIHEIRQKTLKLQKMRLSIKDLLEEVADEEGKVEDYRKEHNLLLVEKMAHVEELRLIHTDINTMENLIKQSSADRTTLIRDAQKLVQQMYPIKQKVDEMRSDIGLERLDALNIDESKFSSISDEVFHPTNTAAAPSTIPNYPSSAANMKSIQHHHHQMAPFFKSLPHFAGGPSGVGDHKLTSQPPPMKSCSSCHQLIHRNAPICPLCKAKSKSRNPKKPRKYQKLSEDIQ